MTSIEGNEKMAPWMQFPKTDLYLTFLLSGRSGGNANRVACRIYNGDPGGTDIVSTVADIPDNEWVQIGLTYNHLAGTNLIILIVKDIC